jgi:hypothetical protein
MSRYRKRLITLVVLPFLVWFASEWWEKALATRTGYTEVSPDGCFRLEGYKPFWVLPNALHSQPHPDPDGVRPFWWLPEWDWPAFYRLYDQHTGKLLSETDVYDVGNFNGADLGVFWGGGKVSLGPLTIADVRDHPCGKNKRPFLSGRESGATR